MSPKRRSRKGKLNRIGRRRRNLRILLGLIAIALIGTLAYQLHQAGMVPANQAAEEWYEAEQRPVELVSLPADDAAHDYYTEWWYYNGHLQTQDGRRFSFHYVIFVINRMAGHTVAHASFIDHDSGRHFIAQQRTAGKPKDEIRDGFDFEWTNWKMTGSDGTDHLAVDTPDFSFDLQLENDNPVVLHGRTGLLDFKQAGTSYYYSRPRMKITGTAGLAGDSQLVSGAAWFDHQWGDFRVTALAWNWFAIQLDDGRDLMLFELFTPQGKKVVFFGTLSGKGMEDVILGEDDFKAEPTEYWYSDKTRINYPVSWRITLPEQDIDLALTPVIRDAEFDGRDSSYLIYWEGPVEVSGSHTGLGYVEMSGYQPSEKPPEAATSSTTPTVKQADTASASTPATRPSSAIVTVERANVRSGPGTQFDTIATLVEGNRLEIIKRQGDWYLVALPGRQPAAETWVYGELLDFN
jgi:predicted secreted hydrolase